MARTTAPVAKNKNDRCHDCLTKAEATVTGIENGFSIRVCLSHTLRYVQMPDKVTVVPDPEANVVLCACNRFVGHGGRAAHKCTAVGA